MRRDRRLERILEAGAEVLAERGFHGCTMRAVADHAGVSPANLYHYVGGKEELLYRVEEQILDRALASAEAASAVRGAKEQLKSFVTDHIRRVLAFPPEAALLAGVDAPLPDHLRRRLMEQRQAYLDLVRGMIDGLVRSRSTRRATSERRALMLLGMADRVALDGARQSPPPRPDVLSRAVLSLLHEGVARKRR
jgi:AcrR family transcriptional regulator